MGENALRLILFFGWLTGSFPAHVPFKKSKRFKFSLFHPILFFSVAIMIFDIALMADFAIHSIVAYTRTTLGSGLSNLVVEIGTIVHIVGGDFFIRIISIVCCPLIIELIQLIDRLEELRGIRCKFCHYMYKAYVTIVVANIFHFAHNYLRVSNFVNFFEPIPSYVQLTMVPKVDWMIKVAFWLNSVFIISGLSYASSICILLGTNLISLYIGYTNELKMCWGQLKATRVDWMGDESRYLDRFIDKFKELKRAFEIYNAVAGPISLAVLWTVVLSLIHSVYCLSTTQALKMIPGTIGALFWMAFVAFFGNFMQTKIQQKTEELKNSMMKVSIKIPFKLSVDHLKEVTQWASDWKWSLNAANFFTVNNSLVPSALATIMTYVIFVFQLQMSDKSLTESPTNSTI